MKEQTDSAPSPACLSTFLTRANRAIIGVPGNILRKLLGLAHPSQARRQGLTEYRSFLGPADHGARDVRGVDMLEQLGHDEGDFQQRQYSGTVVLRSCWEARALVAVYRRNCVKSMT